MTTVDVRQVIDLDLFQGDFTPLGFAETPADYQLERLCALVGELQWVREFVVNGLQANAHLGPRAEVRFVRVPRISTGPGEDIAIEDNGPGFDPDQMMRLVGKLYSTTQDSIFKRIGLGSKIAALKVYDHIEFLSVRDGVGHLVLLTRSPEGVGVIGDKGRPRQVPVPASFPYSSGVRVTFRCFAADRPTAVTPEGAIGGDNWLHAAINRRFFEFEVNRHATVKAHEVRTAKGATSNIFAAIPGMRHLLNAAATRTSWSNSPGADPVVLSDGAVVHWAILDPAKTKARGRGDSVSAHVAARFEGELYDPHWDDRARAKLNRFGLPHSARQVVIHVIPPAGYEPDDTRSHLMRSGAGLPWDAWGAEFQKHLPADLRKLEQKCATTLSRSRKGRYLDRLGALVDMIGQAMWRYDRDGSVLVNIDRDGTADRPHRHGPGERSTSAEKPAPTPTARRHGGGAGSTPAHATRSRPGGMSEPPQVVWNPKSYFSDERVGAEFDEGRNVIDANREHPAFEDLVATHVASCKDRDDTVEVVTNACEEALSLALAEHVVHARNLRHRGALGEDGFAQATSRATLTTVLAHRLHVDVEVIDATKKLR